MSKSIKAVRGRALLVRFGMGPKAEGRINGLRALASRRRCSVNDLILRLVDEAIARARVDGVWEGASEVVMGDDDSRPFPELVSEHGYERARAIEAARARAPAEEGQRHGIKREGSGEPGGHDAAGQDRVDDDDGGDARD